MKRNSIFLFVLLFFSLTGCNKQNETENKTILNTEQLYTDPDAYQGYHYHFLGNIIGEIEYNDQGYSIFMIQDEYERASKEIIVYYQGKLEDFSKGCKVELGGNVEGLFSEKLIKYSCNEIKLIEKPITHFEINQTKTIHGVTFCLKSIHYENDKTKLLVTIENHSSARYNFYDYLTYIQGINKYEAIYHYDENDQILDSVVENNTVNQGVIVFREIERGELIIHIGGYSSSPAIGEINCDFNIAI